MSGALLCKKVLTGALVLRRNSALGTWNFILAQLATWNSTLGSLNHLFPSLLVPLDMIKIFLSTLWCGRIVKLVPSMWRRQRIMMHTISMHFICAVINFSYVLVSVPDKRPTERLLSCSWYCGSIHPTVFHESPCQVCLVLCFSLAPTLVRLSQQLLSVQPWFSFLFTRPSCFVWPFYNIFSREAARGTKIGMNYPVNLQNPREEHTSVRVVRR